MEIQKQINSPTTVDAGSADAAAAQPFVSCGPRGHAGSADAAVRVMRSLRPCSISDMCNIYLVFSFSVFNGSLVSSKTKPSTKIIHLGVNIYFIFLSFLSPNHGYCHTKENELSNTMGC